VTRARPIVECLEPFRMYDLYAVLISAGCYAFAYLLRHVLERI
jgi:hypothetical protein